jgi:hypothetical protein
MSAGISTGFIDFAAFSFDSDRVRCVLVRSFLVRNWCDPQPSAIDMMELSAIVIIS